MPKVRNVAEGLYGDGKLLVHPGEVVEVSEEKANYLCDPTTAGKFERVEESKGKAK
jgi:hypothetical protein